MLEWKAEWRAEWKDLVRELQLWRDAGRTPTLWWRDDDAQSRTAALQPLTQLSSGHAVPVALASIPKGCDSTLVEVVSRYPELSVLQHGYSHTNHAPPDERKCELGAHRPQAAVLDELEQGQQELRRLFATRFLPVLVPPWNRLSTALIDALPNVGFIGLSTLGPRPKHTALTQVNVHVDLIDWRDGRRFVGEEQALRRLIEHLALRRAGGSVDPREATGIMTHHLVQDAAGWRFLARLFEISRKEGARWCSAEELFPGA